MRIADLRGGRGDCQCPEVSRDLAPSNRFLQPAPTDGGVLGTRRIVKPNQPRSANACSTESPIWHMI